MLTPTSTNKEGKKLYSLRDFSENPIAIRITDPTFFKNKHD